METINLIISANILGNNDKIMIRKFFNMIFISSDGLTLHIYTAIAFSAGKKASKVEYFPSSDSNKFSLKFQYDNVERIRFTDLTESLFAQEKLLNKIWGNCKPLASKNQVKNNLEQIYFSFTDSKIEFPQQALYISDPNKSKLHNCVVCEGTYVAWDTNHYFTLTEKYKSKGLEYLNWVKTEIKLNHSLIDNKLMFSIKFDIPQNIICYCPDYMWYTCIPEELVNDLSEAMVSVGNKRPVPNLMQRLADKTALQLHEWIIDENIDRCKRYRLLFDNQNSDLLDKKSYISVTMAILPRRNKHGNRQFIIGLLLAFLLSYASDWTRLNEIQNYLFGLGTFSPFTYIADILFPLCIILMYLSIIMPVVRVTAGLKPHWHFIIKCSKLFGISIIALGLILFYAVFPIVKLVNVSIPSYTQCLIIIFMFLGLFTSSIYIGIGWLWKKLSLYDYI